MASNVSASTRNLGDVHDRMESVRADIGSFSNLLRLVHEDSPHPPADCGRLSA